MISTQTADAALKSIYLDVVSANIKQKTNPILNVTAKNTKIVAGKDIRATIRHGAISCVSAVKETDNLPVDTTSTFSEIVVPLKNIYGSFNITDKALRASQLNAKDFEDLLSLEMQALVENACSKINQMVLGNGGTGLDVNGIDSIFKENVLYNLNKNTIADILPFEHATGTSDFSEQTFNHLLSRYERSTGAKADLYVTDLKIRNKLYNDLRSYKKNVDTKMLEGGFRVIMLGGVPMYADANACANSFYFLNSQSFGMYQLADWTWLESDGGSILAQVEGKPVYTATLVKYCDFICTKPFTNGKVTIAN